jgi:hypothetical protein
MLNSPSCKPAVVNCATNPRLFLSLLFVVRYVFPQWEICRCYYDWTNKRTSVFWKVCLQMLTCGQGGLAPIDLKVESFYHRAAPGGTGGVKTIGNYAPVSLLSSLHFIMDCGVMFGNHYD